MGDVRPPPRSYAVATSAGGRFFLFGGCGAGNTGRLADLWEYDPAANAWRQLPSSAAIKARPLGVAWGSGVWGPSCLCWAAAKAGSRLPDWQPRLTRMHAPLQGRGGAGLVATPGALWVVAGFTGQESNDVHR